MKIETLNLSALKYFLDTVETESLTKAAQLNFVSRPAVSQAIRRLEEWAGKRLTTHEKKTFALTDEGRAFYRRMKNTYESLKQTLESDPLSQRSIKIGSSVSVFDHFLMPALKKLNQLESARIKVGTTMQLKHRLEEGSVNMALFIGKAEAWDFKSRIIQSGSFVLASKSGKLTAPLITSDVRPEVLQLKRILLAQRHPVSATIVAESWIMCAQLASAFNGTCLIPDFLLAPPLKRVPLKEFRHELEVHVAHRNLELLSDHEVELLDLLSLEK